MTFEFTASEVIVKNPKNPLIKSTMMPYPSTLTFNAGVTKFQGRYVMVFRNDYNFTREGIEAHKTAGAKLDLKINLGLAFSDDGITWEISPEPFVPFELNDEWLRAYDPRLTVIDGRCYMCFAVDTRHGIRGGIAVTDDFERFDLLTMTVPDNRNMVLFPEKIGGNYVRLERPFPVYGRGGKDFFDIWLSESPDMRFWGDHKLVLGTENVAFCNDKIGPGAPPVKTRAGWLTTFHAVWRYRDKKLYSWAGNWEKEYFAGIMLLDIDNPSKVVGICPEPLLKAENQYELEGYRGSVIFPGGMILEDSGEVKIYYGAADTTECLAGICVDELISLCKKI